MNTKAEALAVKTIIEENLKVADLPVKIIGSLAHKDRSDHDIDILIDFKAIMQKLFDPKDIIITDWGGIYLKGTKYGDIDLMFYDPEDIEEKK